MNEWTIKHWISFVVHTVLVAVPFVYGSFSAVHLWQTLTNDLWFGLMMLLIVEMVALIGFLFHIWRIVSPLTFFRHVLPFVSLFAAAWETFSRLTTVESNHPAVVWLATSFVVILVGVVLWQCFGAIERLFIDPVALAEELHHEEVRKLEIEQAKAAKYHETMGMFVVDYLQGLRESPVVKLLAVVDNHKLLEVPHDAAPTDTKHSTTQHPQLSDTAPTAATQHPADMTQHPADETQQHLSADQQDGSAVLNHGADRTPHPAARFHLDDLLESVGVSRTLAQSFLRRHDVTTAAHAYELLSNADRLPDGMTLNEFQPLFTELMEAESPIQHWLDKGTSEIARHLNVHRTTVQSWKRQGILQEELAKRLVGER